MNSKTLLDIPNKLGQIAYGNELGYARRPGKGYSFIWQACIDCGEERWVKLSKGQPQELRCRSCGKRKQSQSHTGANWKGGRFILASGYVEARLNSDDFFYPMAGRDHYVTEHRLVMAKHLNRCLLSWEVVHHKNGIRDDNRLENLRLLPGGTHHLVDSLLKRKVKRLEATVEEQAKHIKLLQWQIKEMGKVRE